MIITRKSKILRTNFYLIRSTKNIIIDPCVNYKLIEKELDEDKETIVILTHGHFDHFLEIKSYIKNPKIIFYMHKLAYMKLSSKIKNCSYLSNLDVSIDLDRSRVVFIENDFILDNLYSIYTPGHTNCSISISYKNYYLFTGDFLFKNGIGRCDLYTGNYEDMKKSLMELKNRKEIIVLPGHGENTYLEDELKYNKEINQVT